MNTVTSQNYLADMVNMQTDAASEKASAGSAGDGADARPFEGRAFQALQSLEQDGPELLLALEERLDAMQETFMRQLLGQMAENNTELEERIHLQLSPDGELVVEGNDRDSEKVCDIIAREPALRRNFKKLAKTAMLSHGVEVARQACASLDDTSADNPLFGHYHMYLKGALSHFYVR